MTFALAAIYIPLAIRVKTNRRLPLKRKIFWEIFRFFTFDSFAKSL
jgi:hypothetical protein